MIATLEGKITHKDLKSVICNVNGVGYKVFVTLDTLEKLKKDDSVFLFTYLAVRENALDLYGFTTKEGQDFFELLLTVSGIGPKSAISILSIASPETLRKAVSSGDNSYLTKVSGIGKKTADKIILELREKIGSLESEGGGNIQGEVDAVEALKSLGYSQNEARDALKKVAKEIVSTSDKVRAALKLLGK
ncbi:MAG TPA: Holliday junction branch migration protein RuvA [Candidatus Paceibacterota bacterium]